VWLWGGQTVGQASSIRGDQFADRWDRAPHYFGVEGMAISAILDPGVEYRVKRLDGTHSDITFLMRGKALYCRLPSGRYLTYHDARVDPSERGLAISYRGWNSNPKNGPMGWIDIRTWGGRLVENINQATCRDILRFACINLEQRGYPVVLHVYDEIVCEVPEGFGSLEEFEAIVTVPPFWAREWPIRAPGPWRAKRYRKG
jgi:DNA polymerase